jgi:hypothetical protein
MYLINPRYAVLIAIGASTLCCPRLMSAIPFGGRGGRGAGVEEEDEDEGAEDAFVVGAGATRLGAGVVVRYSTGGKGGGGGGTAAVMTTGAVFDLFTRGEEVAVATAALFEGGGGSEAGAERFRADTA